MWLFYTFCGVIILIGTAGIIINCLGGESSSNDIDDGGFGGSEAEF